MYFAQMPARKKTAGSLPGNAAPADEMIKIIYRNRNPRTCQMQG